jgi:hypothetical protein
MSDWRDCSISGGNRTSYTEFDDSALLRSARKDRIKYLVRGVQGGVFSPNEATRRVNRTTGLSGSISSTVI